MMKIVAFTGAGISKQSNIPTFMERPDVREKLFRNYANNHHEEYNEVIKQLKANMNGAEPNDAHIALAEYEKAKMTALKDMSDVYEQISYYLIESAKIIQRNTLELAQQWIKSVWAPLENENSGIKKYQFDKENILNLLIQAQNRHELNENAPVQVMAEMIMDNYYGAVVTWCINKGKECTLIESVEHYCLYGLKPMINIYKERL